MPGPPGKGGVLVGGGALYIVKRSAPEKQAAAWKYLKFLDDPQTQADFAAGTGYVPIRKSSVDLPAIKDQWAKVPGYKVAYDQLISGANDIATEGPVIGAYQGVRDAVLAGEQEMFTQGKAPAAALKSAASQADSADAGVQLESHRLTARAAPTGGQERIKTVTLALAPRPTVWASPTRAPSTWRAPAVPRSCSTSSTT